MICRNCKIDCGDNFKVVHMKAIHSEYDIDLCLVCHGLYENKEWGRYIQRKC
jgi:hypothetical protein